MDGVTESALFGDEHDDGDYRRIELITGASRRRRWTIEQKAAVVAESFRPGINVSALARRAGVNRGLLQTWRRNAMRAVSDAVPAFVPIHIENGAKSAQTCATTGFPPQDLTSPPADPAPGTIEIESGDVRIRVQGSVDMSALQAVLTRVGRRR
jgi:transposase